MKKLPFLLLLLIFACNTDTSTPESEETSDASQQIKIETQQNDELSFENLKIYPIVADANFIAAYNIAANMKNLKEAIDIKGFRITEKKPYGRFDDSGAVNNLTVQNKSQDTIYLMAGDVIQGGKQDRVLAVDMVVPPRTITDIAVFCVEPNRWDYIEETDTDAPVDLAVNNNDHLAAQNKKVFAFTGYYNVASNDLRRTMKKTNNQQEVWNKVGDLTAINNAESSTGTYANLENSKSFTKERNEYIQFFTQKMEHRDNVIGMVAVSGSKVLGTDIFTHPNLFKKQYEVLIHSYITEAMSSGKKIIMSDESVERYGKSLIRKFEKATQSKQEDQSRYYYKGKLIHYTGL